MENSEVEIFYLENNLQHLFFVSKACYTFTFAPKLFPLQMEKSNVCWSPMESPVWARCTTASQDLVAQWEDRLSVNLLKAYSHSMNSSTEVIFHL